MTLYVLMIGLFLIIYTKKPTLIYNKVWGYILLLVYLLLLVFYVINSTFYRFMSEEMLLCLTIAFVALWIIHIIRMKDDNN